MLNLFTKFHENQGPDFQKILSQTYDKILVKIRAVLSE